MTPFVSRLRIHREAFRTMAHDPHWRTHALDALSRRYPPTAAKTTWLALVEAGDLAALESAVMSSDALRRVRPVI
ncbi:hypothetical protein [Tsukamurella soli]